MMEEDQTNPTDSMPNNPMPENSSPEQIDDKGAAEPAADFVAEPITVADPVVASSAPNVSYKLDTDAKIFAAISYLSILFVIPWVAKKDHPFVGFHVKQGMALFIAEAVIWFVLFLIESFLESLFSYQATGVTQFLYKIAWLVFAVASIYGIYHALKGKEKPLPYLDIVARNLKV